ncbi:MAG: methionine--tRNA ligase, partial [Alphaproteobacteria bacterium]|nr:methionine--tRNA ligase [Alphaproteobacteria bacterium]
TENLHDDNLYQSILNLKPSIINSYCQRDYAQAIRYIMDAADLINQYIDSHKPWQLIKTPGNEKLVHEICSMGINLFRLLMIYLNPVLPKMAEEARTLLHENTPWSFADTDLPLKNHKIKEFKPLMLRVDPEKIKALFATN